MKYAVKMDSGAMYVYMYTKFLKDCFRHSKVDKRMYTESKVISYAYFHFYKIRKVS
jgi:hypothetical protein